MKKVLQEAILLAIISFIFAFSVNSISSNGIPSVGTWYDNRHAVNLEEPPSYDPEMDSLLTMQEAFILWKDNAVFLDTGEHDEYAEGHIPNAINLPFEEWDDYWDEVSVYLSTETTIVCYCGGIDCELSLFTARELKDMGYSNSLIFFGGYNTWLEFDLPVESDYED